MPSFNPLFILSSIASSPIDVTHFIGDRAGASYSIARFIMSIVDWILGFLGLDNDRTIVTFLYATVVFLLSVGVGIIAQKIIIWIVEFISRKWKGNLYRLLTSFNFFHKICRIIPALVFLILIQFTLSNHNELSSWLTRLSCIYIIFIIALAANTLVKAIWCNIDQRANKRKLPLNGIAELVKGIVWIVAIIVVVAIIMDKSPASLLAGLGAFAAVLMLVFKDSILGVVAGVQLSENDSLHVGDWIAVNGTNANGTVVDVSLTAVKVLNWDKTTTTVPPYSLITGGFTNYRTMQQSNTRRICRSFMIDADSILPATPAMLDALRKVPFMDEYITKKLQQQAEGKVADVNNPEGLVNGTIDTNLGLFRAYMKMWLDANPQISHDSDCFVSTLPQTASGIPFQVYCFTATSGWFPYEAIQDSVFEHLAAMLRFFQLYTFENPSSRDTVISGYVSPGYDIDDCFGVPYPFFQDPQAPDSPASTRRSQKMVITPNTPHPAPVQPQPAQGAQNPQAPQVPQG